MTKTPRTTAEIREAFLSYFEKQGHSRVASSSLLPANDPTLLFTNAGMNQFKDCFLGADKRAYVRATSAQKCVRAGGKHNDLENVGFTARHHTFFEMMGNFSFGDYFKKEAIHFAWDFVTNVLKLPKDRLRVSVFRDDDEAAEIWHKQEGVPLDRIVRFDEADNFWQMGDTGPCGPCSEIFWDQGEEVDGDRWLEFWNCVFMQFDRDASGKLTPLPRPSVDTGLGLERTAAILQNVPSNYDIDLMAHLIEAVRTLASKKSGKEIKYDKNSRALESSALRVIVDHLRSTSFLIADGILPSNEGRGYVLRRILRRAVRFGQRLGVNEPFLSELVPELIQQMGDVYPELKSRESVIRNIIKEEEEKFLVTLSRGLGLLDEAFAKMGPSKTVPADVAFKLYDTYGFPLDLTALIAREKNLEIDESGFNALMEKAQELSRGSWKGSGDTAILGGVKEWKNKNIFPRPTFYDANESTSKILAVAEGEQGAWLAIDPTPFYGEGGGQVGDRGTLTVNGKSYSVRDSQKPYENGFAIYVEAPRGAFKIGDSVHAKVDLSKREPTRANHTATHLLHSALRETLGTHVQQAGSLVTEDKLRFDFSHNKAITPEDMQKIESWVSHAIQTSTPVEILSTSYDDATKKHGALAFFSEKYGDVVRVVKIPGLSTELCGGLHVKNTADIGVFKVMSESAVAAGTRRVEAVSGKAALDYFRAQEEKLASVAQKLKAPMAQVEERVEKLLENQKKLEHEIQELRRKLMSGASSSSVIEHKGAGATLKIHALDDDTEAKLLREMGDTLRQKDADAAHIVLAGKNVLITADEVKIKGFHSGDLLKKLTEKLGGRGGGQARTAQGSFEGAAAADNALRVQEALKSLYP
ncbi:MAG: alanine--tRNA ligase [Bdellovibrionota bacterium]